MILYFHGYKYVRFIYDSRYKIAHQFLLLDNFATVSEAYRFESSEAMVINKTLTFGQRLMYSFSRYLAILYQNVVYGVLREYPFNC